jgi:hypothetical protein
MKHPYQQFEDSPTWRIVATETSALERNGDLKLMTAREYVIGALCQALVTSSETVSAANRQSKVIAYQCAFCAETVLFDEAVELSLPVPDGGSQHLLVHTHCLRRALHSSVPLAF